MYSYYFFVTFLQTTLVFAEKLILSSASENNKRKRQEIDQYIHEYDELNTLVVTQKKTRYKGGHLRQREKEKNV